MQDVPSCAFVIFGVTGDLAARKLMPALYHLHQAGNFHPESHIVGFGRSDLSDDDIRSRLKDALGKHLPDFDASLWEALEPRISYVQGTYDDPESYEKLAQRLQETKKDNWLFYTSTPPSAYSGIIHGLGKAGLYQSAGWVHLVIEKPFGNDLDSAKKLNAEVLTYFEEDQIYRIDHYLAKETAQNLSALRFANTLFEPVWSNQYIDHVQISMTEDIGVEGRGEFYEQAGIIRDVFQNHLLQLVALVAMEPPSRYDAVSVRDEKVKVFRAMKCLDMESAVMGQYVAGGGMKGYRDEAGVSPKSRQATYAATKFEIQNWRWTGVPFYVRSGKRLVSKATEIVLRFKKPPHIPFKLQEPLSADRLVLRLVPDEGISFRFNTKKPGQGIALERVSMNFYYDESFKRPNPDAYETLLLDAMLGDATLFMRADEVEAQWRIVDPLLEYWEASKEAPAFYEAGSMGPKEADDMLKSQGRFWHKPGGQT